jgi:hypothetical protein
MSDIKQLLEQTVRSIDVVPSEETIEADLRRGRAALARSRHRRMIRSSVVGAAATTILIGGLIAAGSYVNESPGGPTNESPGGPTNESPGGPTITPPQVQLVAYSGDQLEGFIVDRIPEGWYLQGSSPFALTIAPEGTSNTHPDNFIGKLVVMLLSQDAKQQLPKGEPVDVGGNKGVVTQTGGGTTTLSYEDGEGHFVQVQSPDVLAWTNEQLASFAEGVQVTADAQKGRG